MGLDDLMGFASAQMRRLATLRIRIISTVMETKIQRGKFSSGYLVHDAHISRSATIYAFDITEISCSAFLTNRRVFAFAAFGFPDGIKCDIYGNVYSGCGDGVEVWNPAGSLIGRILVPGGVASFCFGRDGEMFLCAEQRLWRLQLARTTKGTLLGI